MPKTEGTNIKFEDGERQDVKTAAGIGGTTVSTYIRRLVVPQARKDISEFAHRKVKEEAAV